MPRQPTAQIANADVLAGSKPYLERARIALPYLIRQAKAGQTIYYSELAGEVGMPNPRNLNFVLGAIGNALRELGTRTGRNIPPIQSLVTSKTEDLPSNGVDWFFGIAEEITLTKEQRKRIINRHWSAIYDWPYWDWVLEQFQLNPVAPDYSVLMEEARAGRGRGESEQHRTFKEWLATHPEILDLSKGWGNGKLEHRLLSGDEIDILFQYERQNVAVEVKSRISAAGDILRGMFQCIKYKVLVETEQVLNDEVPDCRVVLALEGEFPTQLILAKNLLGIEVIDKIVVQL
jgi:hypothetical protein